MDEDETLFLGTKFQAIVVSSAQGNEWIKASDDSLSWTVAASIFDSVLFQELFPANKRSCEHFSKYFTDAGLKELSDFARNQQSIGARKELQKELQEQMARGDPLKDVSPANGSLPLKLPKSRLLYHSREGSTLEVR